MKVFLAATASREKVVKKHKPLYVLESFCYIKPWQLKEMKHWKMFLLDSGAFTFMERSKAACAKIDWDTYLNDYIRFINKYDIRYFFELDIDMIVGYERVKQMRTVLEHGTQKKCIPVWHKSRGFNEFKALCQQYDYIAIGGIVTREIRPNEYPFMKKLVRLAKQYHTRVHGLGFTRNDAAEYGFYSVDSSAWTSSARYGGIDYFDGTKIVRVATPPGKKCVHYSIREEFVLEQWIKLQKYLS